MAWETRSPAAYVAELAAHPEKRGQMFVHQGSLPRLPVVDLRTACERYLQTIRPVIRGTIAGVSGEQAEAMVARTTAIVNEFCKPGGRGEELHRRLVEHDERCKQAGVNWLQSWWYYAAYHADRVPIPVNSNVYCVSRDHPISVMQEVDWVCRAAGMIHHSMVYSRLIDTGDVPVDTVGKRPLCMDQYRRVFHTCRVPGDPADTLVTYPVEQSRHVIVMVRDHFFSLDVLEADLTPRAAEALIPDLEAILALAETIPPADRIGVLTYETRTPWAHAHAKLIEHAAANKASLETIQSAQLVVVFDEARPTSRLELGRLALQGPGHNRFFDKTIQLFLFRNGRLALNGEHSPGDAPPTAHSYMAFATSLETADEYTKLHRLRRWGPPPSLLAPPTSSPEPSKVGFPGNGGVLPPPATPEGARWRLLQWVVPPEVHRAIAAASLTAQHLIQSSQLEFLEYQPYGMEFIRGKAGLSPDSYIQMAMQLAYYRIYNRFTSTYETQQTRAFLHGRTETGRVLSDESMAFVLAMQDPKATPLQRADALRKAIDVHISYMTDAANGKVFDRYFLGLRLCIKPGEEVPAIFTDPAFAAASNFLLSTSNMTPGQYWQGGFGAYLEQGYGCCYGFRPQSIWVSITSRTTCPTTDSILFKNALHAALDDMGRLVEQVASTQQKAIASAKRSKL